MLTTEQKKTFFQVMFTIAWVDGSIGVEENAILATLFNNVELPEEHRDEVETWFETEPPAPDWEMLAGTEGLADLLMRQVLLVAGADRVYNLKEMQLLERMREQLGMSEADFSRLATEVELILTGG